MLEAIRKKHRRTLWTFSIRGGLAIIVAIFILARPLDSLAALALIVALWALASGLAEIVHALHIRSVFGSLPTLKITVVVSLPSPVDWLVM